MTTSSAEATLGSFSAVDAVPDSAPLIAALDEQASSPAIRRLRAAATELLALRRGDRVVDVGCGTGETTRIFARLVGPNGGATGIDPSATMLIEARRRTIDAALPVEFLTGDIRQLPVDDEAFDATHCERVLQHVETPAVAMAELVRVTRPRGRIVVIDSDWGMHAIHGADPQLTARVVESWAANAANGWSGRQLPSLFTDAGIADPVVVAETFTDTDPYRPLAPPFTTMARVAELAGALTADETARWLAQLVAAGQHNRFFWATTMFAVAGVRR
jgi:ubiquinone/menaquinone biosynthesis C-methylase UbiE